MVHYKPVKITIDAPRLAEVIIVVLVRHHSLLNSIITNQSSLFISKFWLLLYYFFDIKRQLCTIFYLQTDCQTKRYNTTMEVYPQVFVNFEQNNWVRLLPIAKCTYNNAKNASTDHTAFELNCGYHSASCCVKIYVIKRYTYDTLTFVLI